MSQFILCLFLLQSASPDGKEALREAILKDDHKTMIKLLDDGVDVNSRYRYQVTPLSIAADHGNLQTVKILIDKGADLTLVDTFYKGDVLALSTTKWNREVIKYLIPRMKKNVDYIVRMAVDKNHLDIVETALKSDAVSVPQKSALLLDSKNKGQTELFNLLKKYNAVLPEKPSFQLSEALKTKYAGNYESDKYSLPIVIKAVPDGLEVHRNNKVETFYATDETHFINLIQFMNKLEFSNNESGHQVILSLGNQMIPFTKEVVRKKMVQAEINQKVVVKPANWGSFRGKGATGIADNQNPPTTWDVAEKKNLRWKVPLPGMSHSAPVIWDGKVFVTSAISSNETELKVGHYGEVNPSEDVSVHKWNVYCLDAATGKIIWQRTAHEGVPQVKRHTKSTQANTTMAVDGQHVIAHFAAEGLYCYDMNGQLLWKKDLGFLDAGWFFNPEYHWGHSSSPVIHKGRVIVQCDKQKDSYIAALDIKTGREIWRTSRDEIPSWGTPLVVETEKGTEIVANGTKMVRGYDFETGKELWTLGRNSEITVPSPFVSQGLIIVTSGYRPVQPIYAIKPGARGDITLKDEQESNEFIAWSKTRGGPYLPTPIAYGDYLYVCSNRGILTCYHMKTGEQLYRKRIGGGGFAFSASPLASDGKLYFTDESGSVFVIKAGPEYLALATNDLDEVVLATPAIYNQMVIFRTRGHVVAVGE